MGRKGPRVEGKKFDRLRGHAEGTTECEQGGSHKRGDGKGELVRNAELKEGKK